MEREASAERAAARGDPSRSAKASRSTQKENATTIVKRLTSGCLALFVVACAWPICSAAEEPGQRLYENKCGKCHGPEGRGGVAPRLVPFQWSDERALKLVREPECDMPPMSAEEVSDAEVAQIVAYLRTIK
jgi:mono/diheme cytochrome c family protein